MKDRSSSSTTLALAAAAALTVALTTSATHAQSGSSTVSTETGTLRGTSTAEGRQFLGIPYAAPPVGAARWKPPAPAARWRGVRDATAFGSSCPQPNTPFGLASVNEDCLFLNVYTPPVDENTEGDGDALLPVMVWLHPGAFQYGEGSDFAPVDLVQQGVVVVTLNYRLGALGFLSHPALSAESSPQTSGNYGLQDQQAALGWVQRNIRKFGGNPGNVTIFGESAGGLSVHAHMVSPQSAGLFHRAIAQSAAYALAQPTLATAEAQGSAYATAVGCSSQTAACLRAVPVATLLANQSTSPSAYLPKVDGSILPQSIGTAFASGQFSHVPVIEGSTHDEFRLFVASLFELKGIPVTAANYTALISAVLSVPPVTASVIASFYPLAAYSSPAVALSAVGTDAVFACNARVAARSLAQYVPTWAYEFNDPNAPQVFLPPVSFPYGSYHGSEVQYLFDVRKSVPAPALSAAQEQLAASMQAYWAEFARSGDPNNTAAPAWAAYQPTASDAFQRLDTPTPVPYTGTAFGFDHKCAVWGSP